MIKKPTLITMALTCMIAQSAWAQSPEVKYIERSWDGSKVVETEQTTNDYVVLNRADTKPVIGNGNTYVVKTSFTCETMRIIGQAHLILCDGATLTCTKGIRVEKPDNAHLCIYSQSSSDNEGRLTVTNVRNNAGIGSFEGFDCGEITIHGGVLNVTGGAYGAGIGSGSADANKKAGAHGGIVTIYGGTTTVTGGDSGAGIGSGCRTTKYINRSGTFTLYGGTVTATGGHCAAGVGGGGGYVAIFSDTNANGSNCGTVSVFGGTLTAQGGANAAGIGSGNCTSANPNTASGEVNISGGTVIATGGEDGAGIGGGRRKSNCTVNISGGTVTAQGGDWGAGIGGGFDGNGGVVNIRGGIVRAQGGMKGAGIGGGSDGLGGDITIIKGTVVAIAGKDCNCREAKEGSAIGCGWGVNDKDDVTYAHTLVIPDDYMVTAGDAEDNIERIFTTPERVGACLWRNYAKIEPCSHNYPSYTVDDERHSGTCQYCGHQLNETHTFVEGICRACGKKEGANDDLWMVTLHRASAPRSASYADRVVMMVVKGQPFTLPAVNATEGLTLMGYATSWTSGDGIEMKDGETLLPVGTTVTPESDMSYYPRYRYRYVPTWTWNEDEATATLSIVCNALSREAIDVTDITYTSDGTFKTATGTYVHDGATYTFTDSFLLPLESLALLDAKSNEEALDNYNDRKVNTLMLSGRTLYEDGSWNTLCLPFDLSQEEVTSQLSPYALKTLSSSNFDSEAGMLTLNFADATVIEAGKPYLIKWTSGSEWKNPMFNNIVIKNEQTMVTTDYVDFIGTFSPISLTVNDQSVLYLGADDNLYYPSADMTIGSCRAVFLLKDITAGELKENPVKSFVLNLGDETTALKLIPASAATDEWYTLDGCKLSGKPTRKGIYINNGSKIAIK